MNRHQNRSYRRGAAAPAASTFVRVGQKDFYDWTNPADYAEYQLVLGYRDR